METLITSMNFMKVIIITGADVISVALEIP